MYLPQVHSDSLFDGSTMFAGVRYDTSFSASQYLAAHINYCCYSFGDVMFMSVACLLLWYGRVMILLSVGLGIFVYFLTS